MLRDPLFLFKTPSAFDFFQSQFSNYTVCNHGALECPYNNNLHSSLLDRRIMSKLTDLETKSRRMQEEMFIVLDLSVSVVTQIAEFNS